ncbi:hypothetical protein KA529_03720 [Candidatus Saccharibacteria bacterium]|nr:hypothetical protein [Candidatus Saccharibacteria bacterium]
MTDQFEHTQYNINRKFWKLFGASIKVVSPENQLILFAKLKALKLREDIRLFADEAQAEEILRIHARTILDIGTIYDVFDSATDQKIGSVKRKGWKSILQDEWEIWDENEQVLALMSEDSMLLALVRRFLTNLIPQKFTIADNKAQTVANIKQNFNPFTIRLSCNVNEASPIDRRLTMVATIMLAAIEGRQG